jgi:hypothetical protein
MNARHLLTCSVAFGVVAFLYLYDLGRTPVYIGGEEVYIAVQGLTI